MRLAIADPPYPPIFSERFDLAGGASRVTVRSRATRWYGESATGSVETFAADHHPDAAVWDDLDEHRKLLAHMVREFDGWAIATTPDGLGAYHPLPISARVMAWERPNAMPGGSRLISRWEPVIVFPPVGRRARAEGDLVSDVLSAPGPRRGFAGAKPAEWTRWVLAALGYDPATDELVDVFPGSGAVSAAADGMLSFAAAAAADGAPDHTIRGRQGSPDIEIAKPAGSA